MFRMDRKPEAATESPDGKVKVKKWPSEVILSPTQVFSEKAFYYWTHKDKTSSFWAWIIVSVVLAIMLFPLWPMIGKIAVFYLSLYLLIILVDCFVNKARFDSFAIGLIHGAQTVWLRVLDPAGDLQR